MTSGFSSEVVDADAHVNEDPLAWTELAELHPGWLSAGRSGDRWVAQIGDKLYPTQEGSGRGVPIESAISPACKAGAADLDQRLADMASSIKSRIAPDEYVTLSRNTCAHNSYV